jgi:hypothetical protein
MPYLPSVCRVSPAHLPLLLIAAFAAVSSGRQKRRRAAQRATGAPSGA